MTKPINEYENLNPMDKNLHKIPPILYKYRSFDADGFGLKLASQGEAFFASARDFNDPFDNRYIPVCEMMDLEDKELESHIEKVTKKLHPKSTQIELDRLKNVAMDRSKMYKQGDPTFLETLWEIQYNKFGIFSLSSDPRSIPMWSYYADSHKGMCIGLNSKTFAQHQMKLIREKKMMMLFKVQYDSELPTVQVDPLTDYTDEKRSEMESIFYTKSDHWKHENEFRLIYFDHPSHIYTFGINAIEEVIVGVRTSEDNINILLDNLRQHNSHTKVKRAVKSPSKYEIDFESLS